ncbi:MAG TPA: anthranilate phosphoribosyltransferase, partial [Kutzneria sp.]|nr:anthranilate phosphoribosyltransferase [Kutzneria sp.]
MSTLTWPDLLGALIAGDDLTAAQTGWAMDQVMTGEATSAQIAGFAVALRAKGETPDEVLGMADSMLRHARTVDVAGRAIDIVGTGGDQAHTVNISTMTAIV